MLPGPVYDVRLLKSWLVLHRSGPLALITSSRYLLVRGPWDLRLLDQTS